MSDPTAQTAEKGLHLVCGVIQRLRKMTNDRDAQLPVNQVDAEGFEAACFHVAMHYLANGPNVSHLLAAHLADPGEMEVAFDILADMPGMPAAVESLREALSMLKVDILAQAKAAHLLLAEAG